MEKKKIIMGCFFLMLTVFLFGCSGQTSAKRQQKDFIKAVNSYLDAGWYDIRRSSSENNAYDPSAIKIDYRSTDKYSYNDVVNAVNQSFDPAKYPDIVNENLYINQRINDNIPPYRVYALHYNSDLGRFIPYSVNPIRFEKPEEFAEFVSYTDMELLESISVGVGEFVTYNDFSDFENIAQPYIRKLTGLHTIQFGSSDVDLKFVKDMPNLESVDLADGCRVRNCAALKDAPNLKSVRLNLEWITEEEKAALEALQKERPEIDQKWEFNVIKNNTDDAAKQWGE